jgi:hypothetical protein
VKRWTVYTPDYGIVVPVTDEGQGPTEYGCDVIEIEADTRRDAITLGVKEMLKGRSGGHGLGMCFQWCLDQRSDNANPWAGVKAELIVSECPACEGTGNASVHGLDPAPCSACNGEGAIRP